MGIGDWGLGIGDWGLGIGDWAQSPIPNPQSPIPNYIKIKGLNNNNFIIKFKIDYLYYLLKMEGDSKINLIFYQLFDGDVVEPSQKYEISPNKSYIIGRSKKESDLSLEDKELSRRHLEIIYFNNNKIMIKDLNSRNGTFINNNKLTPFKEYIITSKDPLALGNKRNRLSFFESKIRAEPNDDKVKKANIDNNKNYYYQNREKQRTNYNTNYVEYNQNNKNEYSNTMKRERSRSRDINQENNFRNNRNIRNNRFINRRFNNLNNRFNRQNNYQNQFGLNRTYNQQRNYLQNNLNKINKGEMKLNISGYIVINFNKQ